MLNFISFEEVLKSAIGITIFVPLVGIELSPMICHYLADGCQPPEIIEGLLEELDAVIRCLFIEFTTCKDAPRAVVENGTNLLPIDVAVMPIQMHQGQAVILFPSDLGFSVFRLVAVHIGSTMSQ